MDADKLRAALADISLDRDPTRKAARLASVYPGPHSAARDCAKKLAAVALGGGLDLSWKEVARLARQPEYGILPECRALVREIANELKIESPLDPSR